MFQVCTYQIQPAKNKSGMKVVGNKVIATFNDLTAAHEFAAEKPRHFVQYSKKAIKEFAA